jgi:diguanylate cyclase (GGDEF)-like protein
MNPEILEKVLACKRLPSLPAVALKVIEQTQDKNVSFNDLAQTITSDIGLASKLLRTVNSSFYALRKPCGSINQAIVMLGLNAVKTLALGFSLVDNIAKMQTDGFDLQAYWRRTLFSGIAAKCVAAEARAGSDEECFLGGLLQDVGVIAYFMALGKEYSDVLAATQGNHSLLTKEELAVFGVSHADIGAQLATRWKLPPELVMPIRYHERPTAAPPEHLRIVQAVALGNIAAEVIDSPEPAVALKRFYQKSEQWFALKNNQADQVLAKVTTGVKDIASLLNVSVGATRSSDDLLKQAESHLAEISLPFPSGEGETPDAGRTDEVTGLPDRTTLSGNLVAAFKRATRIRKPATFALLSIDQFAELASHGEAFRDAALKAVADRLKPLVQGAGGVLARFDETRFALLAPDADRVQGTQLTESLRTALAGTPLEVAPAGLKPTPVSASCSAGLVCLDESTLQRFAEPTDLLATAERALTAAQSAGPGTLRVFVPKAAAA